MKINREELENIAWNCRLGLEPEQIDIYLKEINQILEKFENILQLDTETVSPMVYVRPVNNVFFDGEIKTPMSQDEALRNAPDQEDGYFKVPKVL